jgi:hypothetical protein
MPVFMKMLDPSGGIGLRGMLGRPGFMIRGSALDSHGPSCSRFRSAALVMVVSMDVVVVLKGDRFVTCGDLFSALAVGAGMALGPSAFVSDALTSGGDWRCGGLS